MAPRHFNDSAKRFPTVRAFSFDKICCTLMTKKMLTIRAIARNLVTNDTVSFHTT